MQEGFQASQRVCQRVCQQACMPACLHAGNDTLTAGAECSGVEGGRKPPPPAAEGEGAERRNLLTLLVVQAPGLVRRAPGLSLTRRLLRCGLLLGLRVSLVGWRLLLTRTLSGLLFLLPLFAHRFADLLSSLCVTCCRRPPQPWCNRRPSLRRLASALDSSSGIAFKDVWPPAPAPVPGTGGSAFERRHTPSPSPRQSLRNPTRARSATTADRGRGAWPG